MKFLGTVLVTGETVTADSADDCRRSLAALCHLSTERVHVSFDRDVYRVYERRGAFVPFATIREMPDPVERSIIDALPFVGAEHVPPSDYQARVLAATAKPRRRVPVEALVLVAIIVLGLAALLLLAGCEGVCFDGWGVLFAAVFAVSGIVGVALGVRWWIERKVPWSAGRSGRGGGL